jgi:hypothetical protein
LIKYATRVSTFGLVMVAGMSVVVGDDLPPAPQSIQQAAAFHASSNSRSDATDSGQCDCLKCRILHSKCWVPWNYFCHDKCFFHYYIQGNGPAIHTRPAAIYWW